MLFISERSPGLAEVWGSSDTDVWAVGAQGVIFHWDGVAWTQVPSPTGESLTAAS